MLTGIPLVASAIAVVTAVLSYGMSRKAHTLAARTAAQDNSRGRSEETMRLLRWAVELAAESDGRRSNAGMTALDALTRAQMVVHSDRAFVRAVAAGVLVRRRGPTYTDGDDFRTADPIRGDDCG